MTVRLRADDMARANVTQAEVEEHNAYIAEHGDPLNPAPSTPPRKETPMPPKYVIDAVHKQFDETTGLPAYPRSTSGTETKLRRVRKSLQTTAARTEAALDRALAQLADALDAEDRKAATQARLNDMTKRNQRRI